MNTENQQRIQVRIDHAGRILAAVRLGNQQHEATVTLLPMDGYELTIPAGDESDRIFASIGQHYVRTDSGKPHLALL